MPRSISANRRLADARRDPEWTKESLLKAARTEFSEHGLNGARVNDIADRAGVNKQLLYYYFGDKEGLYKQVIERAYADIRIGEQALHLGELPPRVAMERLIAFTFDYLLDHRYFVGLLNDENFHKAKHIKGSRELRGLHARLRSTIGDVLKRGRADGSIRRDVDPIDLYISITSLCYFYHSNSHTLSAIFARDLSAPARTQKQRRHIIDLVMTFLTTDEGHWDV